MPVKAKPFGCSQKALAALTALSLHADLKVAMAKGRQPYRLASGGAQAQRLEHRQLKKPDSFTHSKQRETKPE
jgi:hypothetical protein